MKIMKIPLLTEIQRYSLQDGPGIRTTIFVKGCPLQCPWCHNPETQNPKKEFYFYPEKCTRCGRCADVCSTGASSMTIDATTREPVLKIDRDKCSGCMQCVEACLSGARAVTGQELTLDAIVKEAVADRLFFENSGGGVTISGGDPLLFPEFTRELARRLKDEALHVAIETSCFQKWEKIEPLLPYIDLFLVDIKTLDPIKHQEIIGWPLEPILENIKRLIESNANVRIHLPIIPGFNDADDDFNAFIRYLSKFTDRLVGVDILPYHVYGERKYDFLGRGDTYNYKNIKQIQGKDILPLARGLKQAHIASVTIGGLVGMGSEKGKKPESEEVMA